jgi:hypothetical protein
LAPTRKVSKEPQPDSRRRRDRRPDGFEFQSVNLALLWSRLALTATQLARLTGLTRRQIEWWRRRGYLTASPMTVDRFSGDAVTMALLMRQALEAGYTPGSAHQMATAYLGRRLAAGLAEAAAADPSLAADPSALLELQQRLLATHNTIALVLNVLAPLVQREEGDDDTFQR